MISIAYAVAVLAHLLMCSAQNTTEVCEKECSEVCEPCHPKMECNGTDVKLCHPKIDCTKSNLTDCGEQPNNPLEGLCPPKKVCVEKEFNCKYKFAFLFIHNNIIYRTYTRIKHRVNRLIILF